MSVQWGSQDRQIENSSVVEQSEILALFICHGPHKSHVPSQGPTIIQCLNTNKSADPYVVGCSETGQEISK